MMKTMDQSPRGIRLSRSIVSSSTAFLLCGVTVAAQSRIIRPQSQPNTSASAKRQHTATLRASDSPDGSRVALSSDQSLNDYEAYRRGDDIHTLTASQVCGVPPLMVTADHRRQAKVVNFGIVYGLSPFGLSQNLGIDTSEAKQFINAYFEKYKGVRTFIDQILDQARRDQKVKTLFGRIRPIPDINGKNANLRGFAERTAVNTPLQGTAADLIKLAMIRIDAALRQQKLKSRMTLQVHDELVFEVPESEIETMRALVRDQMENVHPLLVPLLVEIGVGPNWRDLEFNGK